ncbi:M4 family metallopeptidase [Longispora sp. NPDC051575]|uniref:M4 family metallopeptidase n=1 Tax=Longispora sp. NPDC051575 TaxID=3154943 RepID=UPI003418DDDF
MRQPGTWSRRAGIVGAVALAGGLLATAGFAEATDTPAGSPRDIAVRDALAAFGGAPGLKAASGDGPADGYTARDVTLDPNGTRHVRFDRTYQGLPVLGGDLVAHSARGGQFARTQAPSVAVDTTPRLDAARAAAIAGDSLAGYSLRATPSLAVDALDGAPALVWQVAVNGQTADGGPSQVNVRVDATSGAILGSTEGFQTFARPGTGRAGTPNTAVAAGPATGNGKGFLVGNVSIGVNQKSDGTYELKDPDRGNGETRDANNKGTSTSPPPTTSNSTAFSSTTTTFGDNTLANRASVGVDAHYGVQTTWDYYKNTHARNGINNDGKGATSYVHFGTKYVNAGWYDSCFCMVYGDGAGGTKPLTQLDVAGHEMSHGVTAATAKLDYGNPNAGVYKESGGLNESTSDIFGTLVEFYANAPGDTPDYLLGEQIDLNGDGTPLRYMDDPTKDGSSKGCWTSSMGTSYDPHLTSGVGNHFFFLAAVGSGARTVNGVNYNGVVCNNAPAVNGIGNDKFGKIWYRALTSYMVSTETYPKARISTLKATNDLYGGAECTAIKAAWTAVGVVAQTGEPACGTATPSPTATASPTASPTPGGTCVAKQLVANGGFESGATSWTASTGVVVSATTAQPAHGGTRIAWLGNNGSASTEAVSQQVAIPAGCKASLTFYLHIDTQESGSTVYDKLTVKAGSTTLGSYSNVNKAAGYALRTFDLSGYAGQTVTLTFTETEDSSLKTSFVVDDVSVTTS